MGRYIFCKKTAIYVLDFFPVADAKPPASGSFFPPAHFTTSLQGTRQFQSPRLGCYEHFRSWYFS